MTMRWKARLSLVLVITGDFLLGGGSHDAARET
jgi:hypothetical protein